MATINDLTPDPSNARKHSPRNIGMVQESISRDGFGRSILTAKDGTIIAGNATVEAAVSAGLVKVRTVETTGDEVIEVRRTDVEPGSKQFHNLAVADNRSAELAEWDGPNLEALMADDLIDVERFWFDDEWEAVLATLEEPTVGLTDPDAVPEPPKEPRTKRGDMWGCGRHRVMCGDATVSTDVARLMAGDDADLCFTSPPYAEQRDYGGDVPPWEQLMRDVFAIVPVHDDAQILVNLGLVHRDGEWLPYWGEWIEWMRQADWRRFGWYVWDQGSGLPGDWNGRLAPSHEFVFHFNRATVRPNKTKPTKLGGQMKTGRGLRKADGTVGEWTHTGRLVQPTKIPDSVIRVNRHSTFLEAVDHPAVFPVAFASEVIATYSGPDALLYEPFSGSGTTMIAAEQLGRTCYAMEINPVYVDVTVARFESFTGQTATLLAPAETGG